MDYTGAYKRKGERLSGIKIQRAPGTMVYESEIQIMA